MPQGKFVESIIGDEYMEWVEGDKIVISTPTGSGKTTFVISKLLRYAVEQGKHIIYYCNRKVLNEQFLIRSEEDIKRFFKSDVEISDAAARHLHILTYQSSELKGNYPDVTIKDGLTGKEAVYKANDILYYIFDEAHYFVNDAAINSGTNFWYEKRFEYGISVFLTATPKPLMALFAGWNQLSVYSNEKLNGEYKQRDRLKERVKDVIPVITKNLKLECGNNQVSIKLPSDGAIWNAVIRHYVNPLQTWFEALEKMYLEDNTQCRIYTYEPDYSYVEPIYFMDFEDLIPEIRKDKDNAEKWLIFIDDEEEGSNLATRINHGEDISAVFVSSNTVKRKGLARLTYDYIVAEKTFPVKILIATSVLDCGIDIISTDKKPVNNIVIACDNETSFLQMLGRRRAKPNDRVRLFIKAFDYQKINNRHTQCTRELRFLLKLSLKNETKLIRSGKSTGYRDGNTYGSALSAYDLDGLVDEFLKMKKPALVKRKEKDIVADCNGYVKEKQIQQMMNYEAHLLEYEYSKTAFLNLVCRMHDYRCAMRNYRSENKSFIDLCAYVYNCLVLTRGMTTDNLKSALEFAPELQNARLHYFPFLIEDNPGMAKFDCSSHMERDREFYLRHQLSWIGKEYDMNCWLGFEEKIAKLTSYLDLLVASDRWLREDETWHEQAEFSINCMYLLLDLPVVPYTLLKDWSRYRKNPEKYPGKDKLEKCFKVLSLPYTIISEQRRYEGKRKTCWKLSK